MSFHRHDAALNVVVFGSKRWMLFPPMPVDGQPGADKAAFSKASWLNPTASTSTDFAELQLQRLRDEPGWYFQTEHQHHQYPDQGIAHRLSRRRL